MTKQTTIVVTGALRVNFFMQTMTMLISLHRWAADLSLQWVHTSEDTFSNVVALVL